MRTPGFAIALAIVSGGLAAQDTTASRTPVGVREFRAHYLPRPFTNAWVAATADGLVELAFDGRFPDHEQPREVRAAREFFQPNDVLDWVEGVNVLVAALATSPADGLTAAPPPRAALGRAGGLTFEAVAAVAENGRRTVSFVTNRCRVSTGHTAVDRYSMAATAAVFRRAALEARSISPHTPPDDAVWYEHAVGCPAQATWENRPPAWPRSVTTLRPHQELVQFVVDASGQVEPGSERFLASSDPSFAAAIREVLPTWRYTSATRSARPVRQLVHINVGFMPPIVLGPGGRGCPDDATKGVVARFARDGRRSTPDTGFLRDVVTAFAWDPVAEPLHGATLHFGYDRHRRPVNLQMTPAGRADSLDPGVRQRIEFDAMSRMPPLPASLGTDSIDLEVEFGLRCQYVFAAPVVNDVASILPQGDGMVRIANMPEADGRPSMRESGHHHEVLPAAILGRLVDTTAALMPTIDTTSADVGDPDRDFARAPPMIGAADLLGLHMWLSGTGWLRGGIKCDALQGHGRFMEVSPARFAEFRRAARAAIDRIPLQPRWAPRGNLPLTEQELTCDVVRLGPALQPALFGRGPQQTSIEVLARFVVDTAGRVEPGSTGFMPGPDSVTRNLVAETLSRWRFRPAMAGGVVVRAQTHVNLVVRPMDADAVVIAASPPLPNPEDTLRRTIFFQPKAPPDRPMAATTDAEWREALSAMQP